MKPIDRFGIDLARVRFLPPSEHNDELFYAEATRKVKKDNTFSFRNRRYETPVDLRDKEIQLPTTAAARAPPLSLSTTRASAWASPASSTPSPTDFYAEGSNSHDPRFLRSDAKPLRRPRP